MARNKQEPSELWKLVRDVWNALRDKWEEKRIEAKTKKAVLTKIRQNSDGLISPTLAYVLIGALVVGAFGYYRLMGTANMGTANMGTASTTSGRSALEQSFIDQVLNPIRLRAGKRPAFLNEHRGTFTAGSNVGKAFVIWSKMKYEADLSYDIQKTNSIVSPHVAQINLTLHEYSAQSNDGDPLGLGDHRTRESVIAAGWREGVVAANTRSANPYTFVYKDGRWTYAPTEYQRSWFGEEQPGPWPILDSKLYEEKSSEWKPLVE